MYTPIKMQRSMKYGNNYWEAYSPKIRRNVSFFSDLEYDNWLHIETNPNVVSFCEQPLRIQAFFENKPVESIFDMWVLYKDSSEEFMEVKYASELEGTNPKALRSIRQIEIQKQWCLENQYNYSVRTDVEIRKSLAHLNNLKQIIGQLRSLSAINMDDVTIVVNQLLEAPLPISKLIEITRFPMHYMVQVICWLVYKGICKIINIEIELCLETEVALIAEKENL